MSAKMQKLSHGTETTNAVKPTGHRDGEVVWDDEKNLGYFAKGSPVLLQFVVKQKQAGDEDVVVGAGSL